MLCLTYLSGLVCFYLSSQSLIKAGKNAQWKFTIIIVVVTFIVIIILGLLTITGYRVSIRCFNRLSAT